MLLILFGGITDRLIPLYAVAAFLAFALSQAGIGGALEAKGGAKISTQHVRQRAGFGGDGGYRRCRHDRKVRRRGVDNNIAHPRDGRSDDFRPAAL